MNRLQRASLIACVLMGLGALAHTEETRDHTHACPADMTDTGDGSDYPCNKDWAFDEVGGPWTDGVPSTGGSRIWRAQRSSSTPNGDNTEWALTVKPTGAGLWSGEGGLDYHSDERVWARNDSGTIAPSPPPERYARVVTITISSIPPSTPLVVSSITSGGGTWALDTWGDAQKFSTGPRTGTLKWGVRAVRLNLSQGSPHRITIQILGVAGSGTPDANDVLGNFEYPPPVPSGEVRFWAVTPVTLEPNEDYYVYIRYKNLQSSQPRVRTSTGSYNYELGWGLASNSWQCDSLSNDKCPTRYENNGWTEHSFRLQLAIDLGGPEGFNHPPVGQPVITGISREGNQVTATAQDITDINGIDSTNQYQYFWESRYEDGTLHSILTKAILTDGATPVHYILTGKEVGLKVAVGVGYYDNFEHFNGPVYSDLFPSAGTIEAVDGGSPPSTPPPTPSPPTPPVTPPSPPPSSPSPPPPPPSPTAPPLSPPPTDPVRSDPEPAEVGTQEIERVTSSWEYTEQPSEAISTQDHEDDVTIKKDNLGD